MDTMPRTLYLRLSESELHLVRYEAGAEPHLYLTPYHLRPQASLTVNLREATAALDILKAETSKVRVVVTGAVTPVPLAEFQEEDCERIYNYCFAGDEGAHRVFYDTVPSANAVLVFSLKESICRALDDRFGEVRYASAVTYVLDHFCRKASAGTPGRRVFVYAHDAQATVAVFEESRLVMVNSYEVQAESDVLYYVFGVAARLGIDLAQVPFFVAGEGREQLVERMRAYAEKVYPVNPAGEFNRHPVALNGELPYDMMCLLLK